jgi:hypothetical protein
MPNNSWDDDGMTRKKRNGPYTIYYGDKPLELLLLPVIRQGNYGDVYGLWLQATGKRRGHVSWFTGFLYFALYFVLYFDP